MSPEINPFKEGSKIILNTLNSKNKEGVDKKNIKIEKQIDVYQLNNAVSWYGHTSKHIIGNLTYPEKETDKQNFLNKLRSKIHEIAKDNVATRKELQTLTVKLETRSRKLRNEFLEKQKKFDIAKYEAAIEKVDEDIFSAKFSDAYTKLEAVNKSISPLSKTTQHDYSNLDEVDFRLDLKIREQKLRIDKMKQVYTKFIQKGQIIKGKKGNNYIHRKANGFVELSNVTVDPDTGKEIVAGKKEKMHWLTLWNEIENKNYKIKKLEIYRDPKTNNYVSKEVNATVKSGDGLEYNQEKARLAGIKLLKQINALYSFKNEAMQKLPEAEKAIYKKAFEENLDKHVLYFEKIPTENGFRVQPTMDFHKAGKYLKQQIFQQMFVGLGPIVKRIKLESNIENEKDPTMKSYYKAEILMAKGRYLKANFYYKQFLQNANKENPELITNAKRNLKTVALRSLNLAKRHLEAVGSKLTKKEYKAGLAIINGAEQELKNDPNTYDLSDAVNKHSHHYKKINYGADNSNKKGRLNAVGFVFGLIKALNAKSPNGVLKNILNLGRQSREDGFTEAAATVFKEVMDEEVQKHKNALLKRSPESYRNKLNEFDSKIRLDIKMLDNAVKYAKKMCGEEWKNMNKKEQREQIVFYTNIFVKQRLDLEMNNFATKDYLEKTEGKTNTAAKEYVDMYNYFDSDMPWNWSDKAIENIKTEVAVNGMMLALSGGVGNIVGNLTKAGLLKIAGSKLPGVLTSILAFTTEVGAFTLTHAGLSKTVYGGEGHFDLKNLKTSFIHNLALLGTMNVGSKLLAPQLQKLMLYKGIKAKDLTRIQEFIQKSTARALSVTAFEAPVMAAFSTLMPIFNEDVKSKISFANFGKNYLHSLKDIAFITAGHKFTNAFTGGLLPKLNHKLAKKAQTLELNTNLSKLKSSKAPADLAKARVLEQLIKTNELGGEAALGIEAILKLAKSKLKGRDIAGISKFMKNPMNAELLIMYEAAQRSGNTTKIKQTLAKIQGTLIKNMQKLGIKGKNVFTLLKSMSTQGLVDLKMGSQLAINSIKKYIGKYTGKLNKILEVPKYKAAWKLFIKDCDGSYKKFVKKHPRIAKNLPPTLKDLMTKVSVVGIAALTGMPMIMGNVEYGSLKKGTSIIVSLGGVITEIVILKTPGFFESHYICQNKKTGEAFKTTKQELIQRQSSPEMRDLYHLSKTLKEQGFTRMSDEIINPNTGHTNNVNQLKQYAETIIAWNKELIKNYNLLSKIAGADAFRIRQNFDAQKGIMTLEFMIECSNSMKNMYESKGYKDLGFEKGDTINVKRSTGAIDSGWEITGKRNANGEFEVTKEKAIFENNKWIGGARWVSKYDIVYRNQNGPQTKSPAFEFNKLGFKIGDVIRTGNQKLTFWEIKGVDFQAQEVRLIGQNKRDGTRTISFKDLVSLNRDGPQRNANRNSYKANNSKRTEQRNTYEKGNTYDTDAYFKKLGFQEGDTIRVKRSNGTIETGWEITYIMPNGKIMVIKPIGPHGGGIPRTLSKTEIIKYNIDGPQSKAAPNSRRTNNSNSRERYKEKNTQEKPQTKNEALIAREIRTKFQNIDGLNPTQRRKITNMRNEQLIPFYNGFKLLGIDLKNLTKIKLKKAYRKKSTELHPDKRSDEIKKQTTAVTDANNASQAAYSAVVEAKAAVKNAHTNIERSKANAKLTKANAEKTKANAELTKANAELNEANIEIGKKFNQAGKANDTLKTIFGW
jgi:hypothetical protein